MPQMSPMSWLNVSLMTMLTISSMNLKVSLMKSNKNMGKKKLSTKSLKWMW